MGSAGLAVGTHWAVASTVDRLVRKDAERAAHGWGRYLSTNLHDIEHIAAGGRPSAESLTFIEGARTIGQVFRFKLFDREGRLRLVSDELHKSWENEPSLANHNPPAAAVVSTGQPHTEVKRGTPPKRPPLYAEIYLPVEAAGRTVAIVEAYLDQTDKEALFREQFAIAGAALAAMIALAFGLPGLAFYLRSRQKRRADERIAFLAHHDGLTGLLNRTTFGECLDAVLAEATRVGEQVAVHFLDLDRFKDINDTLGHDVGDELIRAVADRLRASVRPGDLVARLGGDEFVVAQRGVTDESEAGDLAGRLVDAVARPIPAKDHQLLVSASVGVAFAPRDGADTNAILKSADLALYAAKTGGRNRFRFFEAEMDEENKARRRLEATVRDAAQNNGFDLHFQPLVDGADGRLTGFEALLRLPDGQGGFIPPDIFVPVAEGTGLIVGIGAWVVRRACEVAMTMPGDLTVSVNLSPVQFAGGGLCGVVRSALQETGLPPARLELEITEGLLLSDTDAVLEQVRELKALGVSLAMDDFGTGYSSLGHLWRFPFDKLKIDRSFMRALARGEENVPDILRTVIGLGHSLGMRVTAEGVETIDQATFVREHACDYIQGFYFGKPMPQIDLAAAILSRGTERHIEQPIRLAARR